MKKKFTKKTYFRIISEILFLGVFSIFLYVHSVQKWMVIFGTGVILSLIFSRFYCGWICQMNTIFRPINWLYGKLGIKRLKTPGFMKHKVMKYSFLILIVAAMVLTMKFKIKVNLILYVTITSIALTLIFEESFWHTNICPYGTILSLSSRPAKLSVKIDEEKCIACGLCQKVCPAEAIVTLDNKKRQITTNICLTCFKCQEVCPSDAIAYRI